MKPVARTDRLIKQVVGQETLVYNPNNESASCLNALAACVWRLCDGERTVPEIARLVAVEITLPDGIDAEAVVLQTLEELSEHQLVDGVMQEAGPDLARRDLMFKAFAMIPLFPAIKSITAPTFSSAVSPLPSVTPTRTGTSGVPVTPSSTSSTGPLVTPSNSSSSVPLVTPSNTNSLPATPPVTPSNTRSMPATPPVTPSTTRSMPAVTPSGT